MTRKFGKGLSWLALGIMCIFFLLGCNDGTTCNGCQNEMKVYVNECNILASSTDCTPMEGAQVAGQFAQPIPGVTVTGTYNSFTPGAGTGWDGYQSPLLGVMLPGSWNSQVHYQPPPCDLALHPLCSCPLYAASVFTFKTTNVMLSWQCNFASPIGTAVVPANAIPATLTVTQGFYPFVTTHGMPSLYVYQQNTLGPVASVMATSVASDASSATFPFPYRSNGAALQAGMYSYAAYEPDPNGLGTQDPLGSGYLSVFSNDTSRTTPYGIDAYDVGTSYTTEYISNGTTSSTTTPGTSAAGYLVTLATPGQLCLNATPCVQVGTTPTAVKAYGSVTTAGSETGGCYVNYVDYSYNCTFNWTNTTMPQYAITANYGSNNVSIVNLSTMAVAATIPVGNGPVAVLISPDQTKAFVANYNSNTISEINLSTNTVIATLVVGTAPDTLALDPSGSYLWVAGLNYISEVSLSSFTVVSTSSVTGQVTALGIAGAQNEWVYTTVSTDLSTFQVHDAAITTGTLTINSGTAMPTANTLYVLGGGGGSLPPSYVKASAVVSSNFGNGIVVMSTPTGFVVWDAVQHKQIMQGTTPSPVRGIATDALQSLAYLTAPESNSFITVPVPAPDPPRDNVNIIQ